MRLEIDIPKHQYNNIMEIDSINLGRVSYKGIIMYAINAIKRGKALEQEPTTKNDLGVDCISRAQTQTEIENHASRYTIAKERCGMGQVEWSDQLIKVSDAVDIIRNLPSVTPQEPRWIPVSKKLPEDYETVIVSVDRGYVYPEARYSKEKGWEWAYESGAEIWIEIECDVIAWMPLPQPYSEVEE